MNDVVTIESLAAGGAGVAHLEDGMIVFVPRTAPLDQVELRALRRHQRHAQAQVARVLVPGPARVEPGCVHFTRDRCGGCQWQHLALEEQQRAKRRIVGDALRRIGGLEVADPELVPSPRPLGYRTTITLTVRARGRRAIAGFHDAENPDRVFMLESCAIARDEVNALWRRVKDRLAELPRGDDVRLRLRVSPGGAAAIAASSGGSGWEAALGADDGGGFLQVNEEVAALLRNDVVEASRGADAQTRKPQRVLDLYAGSGDTAVSLARAGCDVTMVELDARAVRQAEEQAKAAGVRMRCVAGRVEDHLERLLPADVIVVNPPRTGLGESVTARLRACASARLIYVSCDPATLARDLKRLGATASRLELLRTYDMFPQTSHVETLAVLAPPTAS